MLSHGELSGTVVQGWIWKTKPWTNGPGKRHHRTQASREMALRQSHDELRTIYDQVLDGIIIVDAETS